MDSREGEGFESNACNREANFYESILPLNKSSGIQTREKKIQQPDISEQYPGWVGVKRKSNVRHKIKAAVTKKQILTRLTYNCAHFRSTKESLTFEYLDILFLYHVSTG